MPTRNTPRRMPPRADKAGAAATAAAGTAAEAAAKPAPLPGEGSGKGKVIFFAADGLRQDLVESYAGQGMMPAMARLLRTGAKAADNGLLTQAPPNTGAGWYTLATGAWPGVHGSTNNTFHINGAPFGNRTAAFDAGVPQAESLAQAAEPPAHHGERDQRGDDGEENRSGASSVAMHRLLARRHRCSLLVP